MTYTLFQLQLSNKLSENNTLLAAASVLIRIQQWLSYAPSVGGLSVAYWYREDFNFDIVGEVIGVNVHTFTNKKYCG